MAQRCRRGAVTSSSPLDTRIGNVLDKIHELGLDDGNTLVFFATDNGAWQDVYPDAGYTPFRGTKGTDREGGNRVPAVAWMPGRIAAGARNADIVGGLDFMATFAALAGVDLPTKDREDQSMIFDSYDISPVLFGTGPDPRDTGYDMTEDELLPGAIRYCQYKFVFNMRGDNGAATGAGSVDSNHGWKGQSKYVATVPQTYDLWQDPQERYGIFMNNCTEHTWMGPVMSKQLNKVMKTFFDYPPRKLQSYGYTGPISISEFQRFGWLRDQLEKDGINITLPAGN